MINKKAVLFLCLFLYIISFTNQLSARQPDPWSFDDSLITAYNHTLHFEFKRSGELLHDHSDIHYGKIYLQHLNDALQLFIYEDHAGFEEFENVTDDRIELIKNGPDSPYKDYFISEIKVHLTFLQIKFGEELSAAWSFRKAYRATQRNVNSFPDFSLNNKTLGLQHIIIGSAPARHQWLLHLLGFDGTIELGLEELSDFSQNDSPFMMENDIIMAFIYGYLLQDSNQGLKILKPYESQLYSNQLINYSQASLLIKNSKSDNAYTLLENFKPSAYAQAFPYTDYMKGSILLEKGEYLNAATHFENFLTEYRGKNNIKDTYYKLGICNWLGGEKIIADNYFEKAKIMGSTIIESDKYAAYALSHPLPDPVIMKLRLYTDGGYYEDAFDIIKTINPDKFVIKKDFIEFHYRQARLYHKTNDLPNAILNYKKTIEEIGESEWYFAPNAALQLGYIYFEKGEYDISKSYFQKCLTFKNHPYKNSIDNKAKAGLSRIKKGTK